MVYEPREDSFLLKKHIEEYAQGTVLEIGTGSGILAKEAAKYAEEVFAVDIDIEAIKHCNKTVHEKNINFATSDMFSYFKDKKILFDLIIFNPPYLPDDERVKDVALNGGKHGYEVLEKFLRQLPKYLKPSGKSLILFSTLTKKDKVDDIILKTGLRSKLIDNQKLQQEELYVYLIEKSSFLRDLEKNKINNIKYFTKGKRGLIFTGELEHIKVAIKAENPNSKAMDRIDHEAEVIQRLNKHHIGPRFLFSGWGYLVYEFVEGVMFPWFIKNATKDDIMPVLQEILLQLTTLDELRINKEEMHHPKKHIIVGKHVTLIDFERAHTALKPQNLTQFCDYLISAEIFSVLKSRGFRYEKEALIELAKKYRLDYQAKPESITNYVLER